MSKQVTDFAIEGAAALVGGAIGLIGGPGTAALGFAAGWGIASDIVGAVNDSEAAQTAADQQAAADKLAQENLAKHNALAATQEQERINELATNQAISLDLYKKQQALEESNQSTSERSAYTTANLQLTGAQDQLASQRVAAQGGASTLVSNSAARGLKVGEGAVKSGQDIAKGNITTNADGSVSYSEAPTNIYDPNASPLVQLAVYERNANKQIARQGEATVGAANLATGQIQSGTQAFMSQAAQNMQGFTTNQSATMGSALLDQQQLAARAALGEWTQASVFKQEEEFTATNLQNYQSSLWLSAFSNVVDTGTSLLGKLWTPKVSTPTVSSIFTQTVSPTTTPTIY
jgi:hypothetical protein